MRRLPGLRKLRGTAGASAPGTAATSRHHTALAPARRPRNVEGRVVRVEQRSVSETVPALVAVVADGRGEETKLIWLGRVAIRGVEVGTRLRASGLASTVKTIPAIYNPTYDLLPQDAASASPGALS